MVSCCRGRQGFGQWQHGTMCTTSTHSLVWFGLIYLFIQPATDVALDMSIQITAKEYNKLIRYGHLSTIINLGQLKQCYSYIKI